MTWHTRHQWEQLLKAWWPVLLAVLGIVLFFVALLIAGCQPQPCLPAQTSVAYVEQPLGCHEDPLNMQQLTYMQAGHP